MVEKLTNVTPFSNSRRIGTLHILKTIGPILHHKWIMLKHIILLYIKKVRRTHVVACVLVSINLLTYLW